MMLVWLLQSCQQQLTQLRRYQLPELCRPHIRQLVTNYRARVETIWEGCVEEVKLRAELLAQDPQCAVPPSSLVSATTRPQVKELKVKKTKGGKGRGQAVPDKPESQRGRKSNECPWNLFVQHPRVFVAMTERITPRIHRSALVQQDSMPMIMQGRTSLSFIASLGFTNLQLLQSLLAVVFLLHAADGAMLPGIFKALEEGLEATPVTLGSIIFVEALCHSIAVLVWGILADRYCKLTLLMYAILGERAFSTLWGFITALTAFVTGVRVLFIVRAAAGTVGAALGPLSQGLIGATCPSADRGRAFGWLIACGQLGFMIGVLLAGATSHLQVIHGWRGTFLLMGIFTLILSWIVYMAKMEVTRGLFQESRTWAQLLAAAKKGTPDGQPLNDIWKEG
eukprot:g14131.t1